MSNLPPASASLDLEDALFAALDDVGEAKSARAFASMSMLGLASPETVAPVLPAMAVRLFDRALPLARRCDLASAVSGLPMFTASLLARLASENDDDRAVAARALAGPRHLEAVPPLARLAVDERVAAFARVAAVDALAAIGDASVVGALDRLLDDLEPRVRRAAVIALRALDASKRRAPSFLRACSDVDVDVRCAALTALLVIGGPSACVAGRAALVDDAGAVRALAVVILARHGAARDAARVQRLAGDDDARVRRAVREARATAVA